MQHAGGREWLDAVLRRRGVREVLDASCGSCRQAIPLAERGYTVVGAGPGSDMLREARREARARGVQIQWIEAPFKVLPTAVRRSFGAVIVLRNGLCTQESPPDILRSLHALCWCTAPRGLCLIGIKDYDRVRAGRERFRGYRVRDKDGSRTVLFEIWDFEGPILICTAYSVHGHVDDWTVHGASTREYMLDAEEVAEFAGRAGFDAVDRLDHPSQAVYALLAREERR